MADSGSAGEHELPKLEPGAMFAGYRIESLLDRGGMGVLYKATDPDLDRVVALKIIAPEHTQNETAVARFKAEARLAASIEHQNIVPIHRAGEEAASSTSRCATCRDEPAAHHRPRPDGAHIASRGSSARSPTRSTLRTPRASSTATSSRRTSSSAARARTSTPTSRTSGSPSVSGRAMDLTRAGAWVGTPDYVAPEQIQGHTVDRPRRRLFTRLRALRDAHRPRRVPEGQRHGQALGACHRPAAACRAPSGPSSPGLRRRRRPRDGEGPRRALRDRRRARRGRAGGASAQESALPGARGRAADARERCAPSPSHAAISPRPAPDWPAVRGRGRRAVPPASPAHLGRHAASAADAGPAGDGRARRTAPGAGRRRRPAVGRRRRRHPAPPASRADAHRGDADRARSARSSPPPGSSSRSSSSARRTRPATRRRPTRRRPRRRRRPAGQRRTRAGPDEPRHGVGDAKVRLNGHDATVTVNTTGLLNTPRTRCTSTPGRSGVCPPGRAAEDHGGHLVDQHARRRAVVRAARDGAHDARRHEQEQHPRVQAVPAAAGRPLQAHDPRQQGRRRARSAPTTR